MPCARLVCSAPARTLTQDGVGGCGEQCDGHAVNERRDHAHQPTCHAVAARPIAKVRACTHAHARIPSPLAIPSAARARISWRQHGPRLHSNGTAVAVADPAHSGSCSGRCRRTSNPTLRTASRTARRTTSPTSCPTLSVGRCARTHTRMHARTHAHARTLRRGMGRAGASSLQPVLPAG
jgi:hypothetical protein